jgi:hypothetical protein
MIINKNQGWQAYGEFMVIGLAEVATGLVTIVTFGRIRPLWSGNVSSWVLGRQLTRVRTNLERTEIGG